MTLGLWGYGKPNRSPAGRASRGENVKELFRFRAQLTGSRSAPSLARADTGRPWLRLGQQSVHVGLAAAVAAYQLLLQAVLDVVEGPSLGGDLALQLAQLHQ